jgi:putative LysE/RhtB family amino acid efflux pump
MTIFFFAAIFAGIGVSNKSIPSTILGIFIGSVLWWIILSNGVGFFRKKINNQVFKWINRISGIIIVIFAFIIIANMIW